MEVHRMANDTIQLLEDRQIRSAWDAKKEGRYSSVVDAVTALNDRREHAFVAACSRRGKWNSDKLSRFEDDRRRRQKAPHRLRPSRSSSGRLRCAVSAAFILFDTESCVFAFFRACQCHAASRAARDLTLSPLLSTSPVSGFTPSVRQESSYLARSMSTGALLYLF